jgi:hypothetical protein
VVQSLAPISSSPLSEAAVAAGAAVVAAAVSVLAAGLVSPVLLPQAAIRRAPDRRSTKFLRMLIFFKGLNFRAQVPNFCVSRDVFLKIINPERRD